MAARVGDLVELVRDVSVGILSTARKGTKGVVLKEPGLLRSKYTELVPEDCS